MACRASRRLQASQLSPLPLRERERVRGARRYPRLVTRNSQPAAGSGSPGWSGWGWRRSSGAWTPRSPRSATTPGGSPGAGSAATTPARWSSGRRRPNGRGQWPVIRGQGRKGGRRRRRPDAGRGKPPPVAECAISSTGPVRRWCSGRSPNGCAGSRRWRAGLGPWASGGSHPFPAADCGWKDVAGRFTWLPGAPPRAHS